MIMTRATTMVGAAVPWVSEFERETYSPTLTRILNHADALGITGSWQKFAPRYARVKGMPD